MIFILQQIGNTSKLLKNEGKIVKSKKFLKDYEVLVISKTGEKKGAKSHDDLTCKNTWRYFGKSVYKYRRSVCWKSYIFGFCFGFF